MRRTSYVPLQQWHKREKTVHPNGYILVKVPEHPKSFRGGWYYEHRLVAEREMGRILPSWVTVHHINEDKTFNVWENLFPCSRLEHNLAS
jgi:hypothetical protein